MAKFAYVIIDVFITVKMKNDTTETMHKLYFNREQGFGITDSSVVCRNMLSNILQI